MMPFDRMGVFWLPAVPSREISGRLVFDSDGITLTLFAPLREFVLPAGEVGGGTVERVDESVVYGRFHDGDEDVSVLGVSGSVMPGPFDVVRESYFAQAALVGGHARIGTCCAIRFGFDVLAGWVNPPPLADVSGERVPGEVHVRVASHVIGEASYAGRDVRLVADVEGKWGQSVHLDQHAFWEIAGEPLDLEEWLSEWARAAHDLLVVCLGRAVALTQMRVRARDVHERERWMTVALATVQQPPATAVSAAAVRDYDAPTLLLPDNSFVPFDELVPKWYALRSELGDVVKLLCSPFYAPFMYGEHRYGSLFQAAEALAKKRFVTTEKSREEHAQRVQAIVGAAIAAGVAPEDVAWAGRVLQSRNDRPLPELVTELLRDAGSVGTRVLDIPGDVARLMVRARTGVSHGGAAGTTPVGRYWLGQVLLWVLRMRLLRELGVPAGCRQGLWDHL